jgi:hypothetical protein
MEPLIEPRAVPVAGLASTHVSSVASWGAIIAGTVAAAAVTVILVALAAGLGLASVSPWADRGVSGTTCAVETAIGFIVMQWLSAGIGGYLTGRLRTRWIGTHTHEVFFRDTAHGFVTWALSTLGVATVLSSSLTSLVGSSAHGVATVAGAGMHAAAEGGMSTAQNTQSYGLDKLFHADSSVTGQSGADPRIEASHIVAQAISGDGEVPDADRSYLANLVAAKTGVSADDAKKRVDDFIAAAKAAEAKAKAAADTARKVAAEASLYTALSMLLGAFIASVAAVLGGRGRDEHL